MAMPDRQEGDVDAVLLSASDNVVTTLRTIAPGERIRIQGSAQLLSVTCTQAIPMCHKVALDDLILGAHIIKYGAVIGAASQAIKAGAWVHVHNLRSLRGQQ